MNRNKYVPDEIFPINELLFALVAIIEFCPHLGQFFVRVGYFAHSDLMGYPI